jgi:Fur family iron response transcriptional regulator
MNSLSPIKTIEQRVRDAGLRPTRQRTALAELLFAKGDRHLSAEELHEEALAAGVAVSLATVYNTLHQFTGAGLMREVVVEPGRSYFDTNTSAHHHFFFEDSGDIQDIPEESVNIAALPNIPPGTRLNRVDVVVRLSGETPESTD